jgi:hypothetical protein
LDEPSLGGHPRDDDAAADDEEDNSGEEAGGCREQALDQS